MWGTQGGPNQRDDLAHFLRRVGAWSGAKPPNTYINIHAITPKGSPRETSQFARRGGGRAFLSMEEYGDIMQYVGSANRDGDGVFLCMSSRDNYVVGNGRWRKAARKAPKSNPVALKALWLDLDVKPDAYPDLRTALRSVLPFFAKLGIEPLLVMTGNGLHAYIVFDQTIPVMVWRPLAEALIAAARQAGLKFDIGVSRDDDRILRVPGTVNAKNWADQKPCKIMAEGRDYTLAEVTAALKPWHGLTSGVGTSQPRSGLPRIDPAVLPPRRPITSGPLFDRVSADLAKNRVVTSFDLLRGACPVVADSAARRGSGDVEPLWFELAKLCHYVEDGRRHFHDLSAGDHRYEPQQTDAKFDGVSKEGWPSCLAIEQSCGPASALCMRCVNRGQSVAGNPKPSPIHFAQRGLPGTVAAALPTQTTIQPLNTVLNVNGVNGHASVHAFVPGTPAAHTIDLPPNWQINPADGKLYHVDPTTQMPDPSPVFNVPIDDLRLVASASHQQMLHIVGRTSGTNKTTTGRYPVGQLCSSQRDATSLLFTDGFHFNDYGQVRPLLMDLQTFIRNNRRVHDETRNGWQRDDNNRITGFSYGGFTYEPTGPVPSPLNPSEKMRPMGDLVMWRQAANYFLGRGLIEMEALMSVAYAAPLLPFTSVEGVIVYGHSGGTGFGKSASLETAQTVWGPRKALVNSTTPNRAMDRLMELNNLPGVFDEFLKKKDGISARQFTELVYTASSGQEKERLSRSSKPMETRSSQTILVTAGNGSLVELASTKDSNAIAARVFELRMSDAVKKIGHTEDMSVPLKAVVDTNYGVAGAVYAEFLGRNHGGLQPIVVDTMREFQRLSGVGQEGRFWLAAAATMYIGACLSTKLDLQKFDTKALRLYLIDQMKLQQSNATDAQVDIDDPEVAMKRIAQFCNEHRQATVVCEYMPRRGAQTPIRMLNGEVASRAQMLAIRHATLDKVIEISEARLQDWCRKQEISFVGLKRSLEKAGHINTRAHKRLLSLTRGIIMENQTRAEKLLHFDLTLPLNASLEGVQDDV